MEIFAKYVRNDDSNLQKSLECISLQIFSK